MASTAIRLLNGPNLNLLGSREVSVYGTHTLSQIEHALKACADKHQVRLDCMQSNHEGQLIDAIHQAKAEHIDFIIINPGGLTHTSVALRDAFAAVAIPFIEVHISNVHAREPFRRHSYLSELAVGVVCGLGVNGYLYALEHIVGHGLDATG